MANFENQPNKEELIKMGIQAARNDQRQAARMMFEQVLDQDEDHVRALMWMAKISTTPEDRAHWLHRVLEVDPDNKTAHKVLGRMEQGEDAERNKLFLQLAVGAYMFLLPVVMLFVISAAT